MHKPRVSQNIFEIFKSPTTRASLAALTALTLAACAPAVQDEANPWTALPHAVMNALPQGAVLERAGSIAPDPNTTQALLGSLAPGSGTPETRVPAILARGYLIVGIAQSQNLLSFQNFSTGEMNGFEVDIARAIAEDIFGDSTKVDFRFIDATDQITALENGSVDIILNALSVTRGRQDQLSFSTPYFQARTQLLTLNSSTINTVADLDGKTVCAVFGSTGVERARQQAPHSDILKVRTWADCLIALQQNQTDAIISDNTILAGMYSQDPTTRIVPLTFSTENYAVGIATPGTRHDTEGLIRQVNSTIEKIRSNGQWMTLYNRWFAQYLDGTSGTVVLPPINYREEV
ncbi:MAG: glutamate ABC transporter substrate-binding protein [Corynebacterium sp.]|nr:glutamate ABC transporter substrate-binding protein [Corynebacterium sp.]